MDRGVFEASIITTLIALAFVGALPAAAQNERATDSISITEGLTAMPLGEAAWVVTSDAPWPANVLVVRMADGSVVLADTPPTEAWTVALLDWIGERLAPPSIVAVNSHYHIDATGGNRVLRDRGIPIWGSESTAELIRTKAAGMLRELRESTAGSENEGMFDQDGLVEPDHLLDEDETRTLDFGAQRLVILDPGPAHSSDNIVAWFPDHGILFGGCMVKSSANVGYLGDASLDHWPEAIDRLRALEPTWVVPGHGRRFDPEILDLTEQVVREAAAYASD